MEFEWLVVLFEFRCYGTSIKKDAIGRSNGEDTYEMCDNKNNILFTLHNS